MFYTAVLTVTVVDNMFYTVVLTAVDNMFYTGVIIAVENVLHWCTYSCW